MCVLGAVGGGGHTWEVSKGTYVLFWNTPSPHPASRRPNNAFPEFFYQASDPFLLHKKHQ